MSNYTASLGLEQITPGDQAGLWGNTTNNNLALIDQAVTGVTPINFGGLSGTVKTLDDFDGAVDEARSAVLNITGIATGSNTVVVPNKQKTYLVRNNTGQDVIFRTASPTATYNVGAGNSILIFCDGNNNVFTGIASPSVGTLGVAGGGTGSTTFTAGFVKSTGGTNALTSSSAVSLSSEVSGTLPVANGGTGASTLASGGLIRGNDGNAVSVLLGTVNGQVATWNGSQWVAATPSTGVASFSGGVTGLTPATTTTGAITLGGVLEVTSGGTGATTPAGARTALGLGTVATINTSGSTTTFLRGDGVFATPPASGGTVTQVTGTGSVSGITLSGTVNTTGQLTLGGALTLSSTQVTTALGYSPVPSNGSGASGTWNISISGSAASASTATTATTASSVTNGVYTNATNNFTGTNNYSTAASIVMSGSTIGDQRIGVSGAGMSSGMSPSGMQLGAGGWGMIYGTFPDLTIVTGGPFTTAFRQSGNFQSSNSPNWATTSDINIKTNKRPINDALGKLTALNPCHFEYKDELGKTRSGFIAQEFENVFPGHTTEINVPENYKEFVPEGVDKLKTLDLNLTPYLVKAIQELKAELDLAKAEIAELKAK